MYLPAELEDKLVKFMNDAAKYKTEWALAQEDLIILEDRKHDELARITLGQEAKTQAEKERLARVCEEWTTYKTALIGAKIKALKLKVKFQIAERGIEVTRSLMSSLNIERKNCC